MIGALTFYTDDMPIGFGGYTRAFLVYIKPKYKDDVGLHEHEYMHVKQWWVTTFLSCLAIYLASLHFGFDAGFSLVGIGFYSILYDAIPWFKLRMEVQAYRKQMQCYPDDRSTFFAYVIANKYDLKVSADKVIKMLRE